LPSATPPAAPPPDNWWKRNAGSLVGPTATVAIAVVSALVTTYVGMHVLEQRIAGTETVMQNAVNTDRSDIEKLQSRLNAVEVAQANTGAGNSGTFGKLEVSLNAHAAQVANMQAEVTALTKNMSYFQGTHAPNPDAVTNAKIAADIASIRERLAVVETLLKAKSGAKD